MRFRAERPRKYLVWCLRNSYTFVALKLAWARREGGSVSPAIRDRLSNEAPGQFQRNPRGGMSFGRRRCCSLLTDPLRDMLWCPCGSTSRLVWCLAIGWCFVAPKTAWGKARRGRDTTLAETANPRPSVLPLFNAGV